MATAYTRGGGGRENLHMRQNGLSGSFLRPMRPKAGLFDTAAVALGDVRLRTQMTMDDKARLFKLSTFPTQNQTINAKSNQKIFYLNF